MRVLSIGVLISSVGLLAACGNSSQIVIGSKNFTEQVILGELLAQAVERQAHLSVDRRLNLGGTLICHESIVSGQIDMYVEYTGTGLTAILKQPVVNDPKKVYETVSAAYLNQFKVRWAEPLGFNNTFVIVVRPDDAAKLNLKTISDAVPHSRQWTAGFGYEFMEREDGFPGLAKLYGLSFARAPRVMDLGLTYKALASGEVDVIAGDSTNGLIDALKLFPLEDDKHYFPPYDAVPLVRQETLDRHPEIGKVLAALGGRISEPEIRRMNLAVDGEKRSVPDVVREFLESKGL